MLSDAISNAVAAGNEYSSAAATTAADQTTADAANAALANAKADQATKADAYVASLEALQKAIADEIAGVKPPATAPTP